MTSWVFYFNVGSIVYFLYNIISWRLSCFTIVFGIILKEWTTQILGRNTFVSVFLSYTPLQLSEWHYHTSFQLWCVKLNKIWDTMMPNIDIVYFLPGLNIFWANLTRLKRLSSTNLLRLVLNTLSYMFLQIWVSYVGIPEGFLAGLKNVNWITQCLS